jgi:hypothetical protein
MGDGNGQDPTAVAGRHLRRPERSRIIVIELAVGDPDAAIEIVMVGIATYTVDPELRMTYATREYIAGLVAATLKLSYSLAGDCYNGNNYGLPTEIARIKGAVQLLVKSIDPKALHHILRSLEPRHVYAGDVVGSLELDGWDYDGWLVS